MSVKSNIIMDQSPPKALAEQIEELKKWSVDQSMLPELSDRELELFLNSCEYNVEETKRTVISYYKLRIQAPEFFSNRDPTSNESMTAYTLGYSILLPGATEEGYKVILAGYTEADTKNYVFVESTKRFLMTIDMWLSKLETCPGILVLIDCKNCTFSHCTAVPFDGLKKLCAYFQEALPVQLQGVYFINISSAMNMLLSIVQPFLSKKITNLIHKYVKGNESFQNAIPKQMLPQDMGGEAGTIQELHDAVHQELTDYINWFREEDEKIKFLMKKSKNSNVKDDVEQLF